MNRFLVVICLAGIALIGCAQLLKLQGQAEEKTVQGIEAICENTDEEFRAKFIAGVNEKAAPNSIQVNCVKTE